MFTKIIYYISSNLTCLQPSATPFSCTQKRGKCYQLNCDTLPIIKWIQFQKCKSVHLSTDKMWLYTVVSMYEMSSDQIQVNRNAQGLNILVYWISRQHRVLLYFTICWKDIGSVEMADTTVSQCKHHSFSASLLPPPYLLSLKSNYSLEVRLAMWSFSGPHELSRKPSGKDFLSWAKERDS